MSRSLAPLTALALVACAHTAPASETLPKLKLALVSEVSTPEQNAKNSTLVEQISNDKQLQGLDREEVSEQVGRGDLCSRHPICGERGFASDDWYYEVGRESGNYVRHRPALILGFSRFGKVERTFVLRAPE